MRKAPMIGLAGVALAAGLWAWQTRPDDAPETGAGSAQGTAAQAAATPAARPSVRAGGADSTDAAVGPDSVLSPTFASLPRAYQPAEMRKVGHYLQAWLAERPADQVDAELVDVDCASAPCLLTFDCDRATADALGFLDLLVRQFEELTVAQRPRLATRAQGERLQVFAYFLAPGVDEAAARHALSARLPSDAQHLAR